jgi:hypothetical protein
VESLVCLKELKLYRFSINIWKIFEKRVIMLIGEGIITTYINSQYPDRLPKYLIPDQYIYFVEQTCDYIKHKGVFTNSD